MSHMDEEQLDTFAMAMFPVSFSAGESIIRQGDDGDNLYIVASGQCSVWLKKGESKGPIKARPPQPTHTRTHATVRRLQLQAWQPSADASLQVAEYGPGGCFGELALLHNAPRAASVIADSAVQAWAIDRVSFKRIMMSSSLRQQDEYMNFIAKVAILGACALGGRPGGGARARLPPPRWSRFLNGALGCG